MIVTCFSINSFRECQRVGCPVNAFLARPTGHLSCASDGGRERPLPCFLSDASATFHLLSSFHRCRLPSARIIYPSFLPPPPLISLSPSPLPPDSRLVLPRCGNRDHDDDGTRTSRSSSACATLHIRNPFLPSLQQDFHSMWKLAGSVHACI